MSLCGGCAGSGGGDAGAGGAVSFFVSNPALGYAALGFSWGFENS